MFLFKVLGRSFSSWWSRIGYTLINGLFAALNPFLAWLVITVVYFLYVGFAKMNDQTTNYIFQWALLYILMPLFPTSFAALSVQNEIVEGNIFYFKDYLQEFLKTLVRLLLPSLLLIVIYTVIIYLLVTSGMFYGKTFTGAANTVINTIISALFVFFVMSQWIMLPLFFEPYQKIPFLKKVKLTLGMTGFYAVKLGGLVVVDILLFAILTVFSGMSIFLYFGLSFYLRVHAFRMLMDNLKERAGLKKEEKPATPEEIEAAWASLSDRK